MKKTDFAYTAGIIDGEGCILIRKIPDKTARAGYCLQLLVELGSTDEWLPQWLKFAWGGQVYYHEDKRRGNFRPTWRWMIASQKALSFLLDVFPYLRLKQPQAELAICFQSAKGKRGHRLSDEHKALEEAQAILIKKMKGRITGNETLAP